MPVRDVPARLERYYDGDSFYTLLWMGLGSIQLQELRLIDVEAPEIRELRLPQPARGGRAAEPGAAETATEVARWMGQVMVEAKDGPRWYLCVRMFLTGTMDPTEKLSFNRLLAVVWPQLHRPADAMPGWKPASTPGPSLNEHLVGWLREHGWTDPFKAAG